MNSKLIASFACLIIFLGCSIKANAWTLESSIAQAVSISPELKQSAAFIGTRNVELKQSSLWPDPSLELKVDNQRGRDTGSGNYNLSEITFTQDIPLSRIKHQTSVAEARLSSAIYAQSKQMLILQNQVSKVFFELQLTSASFELARQRVALADKLSQPKNKPGQLIRYLSPLEKMRLNIISEQARQAEAAAEGRHQEVLMNFNKLLGINAINEVKLPPLSAMTSIPDIGQLTHDLDKHPSISTQKKNLQAASNGVELARSSAIKDPSISLNRLRENFSSGTENVYGIMLNIQLPIHDRKTQAVSRANYNARLQRIELGKIKRDLQLNLKRSYTHLNHLIKQASEYKTKVLKPASKILDLSKKGFNSGELNILSLIDANNTYFDSHMQYLNLIYQSWLEVAEINLNAGKFITQGTNKMPLIPQGDY